MEPASVLHGDLVAELWVVSSIAKSDDLLLDTHFAGEGSGWRKMMGGLKMELGIAVG
jgi:hypothetical protein